VQRFTTALRQGTLRDKLYIALIPLALTYLLILLIAVVGPAAFRSQVYSTFTEAASCAFLITIAGAGILVLNLVFYGTRRPQTGIIGKLVLVTVFAFVAWGVFDMPATFLSDQPVRKEGGQPIKGTGSTPSGGISVYPTEVITP